MPPTNGCVARKRYAAHTGLRATKTNDPRSCRPRIGISGDEQDRVHAAPSIAGRAAGLEAQVLGGSSGALEQRLDDEVADESGADTDDHADDRAEVRVRPQRVLRPRGRAIAPGPIVSIATPTWRASAVHERRPLRVRAPARGAVGDQRSRQLADGHEHAQPEEQAAVRPTPSRAIGAPTSRTATITAHPMSGAITSWRA